MINSDNFGEFTKNHIKIKHKFENAISYFNEIQFVSIVPKKND